MCCPLVGSLFTLDSAIDIGVFLSMQYFTYFMCNPVASSPCNTKHPPYIKKFIKKQ